MTGEPGREVELQATSDLKLWEPITSVTLGNEAVNVEDSAAAGRSLRFYLALQTQ